MGFVEGFVLGVGRHIFDPASSENGARGLGVFFVMKRLYFWCIYSRC